MNKKEFEDFLNKNVDCVIDQSFYTEEGFVNEACLNQLNKAILNMPKTYERLKDNPEWVKKRWIFRKNITASFAKYAISLSPYSCPDNLEKVIRYLDVCLEKEVKWSSYGMVELSLCDINKLLYDILYEQNITVFDEWNKPKKNWRKNSYQSFQEVSEKDSNYDFIDLDALLRNVCLDIRGQLPPP